MSLWHLAFDEEEARQLEEPGPGLSVDEAWKAAAADAVRPRRWYGGRWRVLYGNHEWRPEGVTLPNEANSSEPARMGA